MTKKTSRQRRSTSEMPARLRIVGFASSAALLLLTACGGPAPEVALPDVRGVALDDAADILEDAGFKRVEDDDHFEDRMIFIRSNWVVIDQTPAPGAATPTDTTVLLSVGKLDDDGVLELLPEGSPIASTLTAEAAEREERRKQEEAAQAKRAEEEAAEAAARAEEEAATLAAARKEYIEKLDPAMRVATQLIANIETFHDDVRTGSLDGLSFRLGADTVMETGEALVDGLTMGVPPESIDRAEEFTRLQDAAEAIDRAADTLASADGVTRDSSLERFEEIWGPAVKDWNGALKDLYAGTGVKPPKVE